MDLNWKINMPIQYGEEVWYSQKNYRICAELTHPWSSVVHLYMDMEDGTSEPLWVGHKSEFLSNRDDLPRNFLNMINIRRIREN